MQVFPQCLARRRWRMLDAVVRQLAEHGETNLFGQRLGSLTDLRANENRQQVSLSQARKHTGFKQRSLSQARLSKEHRDRFIVNPPLQFLSFGCPATEEFL